MAVTTDKSLYFSYLSYKGEVDHLADEFRMALMSPGFTFDRVRHKAWDADAWVAETIYSIGDTIKPTTGSPAIIYRATVGGTSGTTEPTWKDPDDSGDDWGDEVVDGGVTWEAWSYLTISDEITHEGGYSGPLLLVNPDLSKDEDAVFSQVAFDDAIYEPDPDGSFGPAASSVMINTTHQHDPVVGYVGFDSELTASDGTPIEIRGIRLRDVPKQN